MLSAVCIAVELAVWCALETVTREYPPHFMATCVCAAAGLCWVAVGMITAEMMASKCLYPMATGYYANELRNVVAEGECLSPWGPYFLTWLTIQGHVLQGIWMLVEADLHAGPSLENETLTEGHVAQ